MAQDRMQRDRYELKYMLDEAKAIQIRHFVRGYLALDEAGLDKPNNAYRVNSIYLDSPSLHTFWDWVNANHNRFKLRLRFYDTGPNAPVFLEIKRRASGCILKQRCAIRKEAAPMVLAGQFPPEDLILSKNPKGLAALGEFITLSESIQAQPKALVTYLREAYVHPTNDGLRLTLDRQVRLAPRSSCDFGLHLDCSTQPFGEQVVLELKFNNRYPQWFNEMVQMFDLTRSAAAKYCEGIALLRHPEHGHSASKRVLDPWAL